MRSTSKFAATAAAAIASARAGMAVQLNAQDINSVKAAAGEVAKGLYVYHNEAATTGQFIQPEPWYWWLSGSGWTGIMDYTVYTKDTTYKADLLSALAKNVGPNFDFTPPEQAAWEANDDQAYWLYNALTAMEYSFDTIPGAPTWDVIATNTFNLFVSRWNAETETCNGGLKWQYNPSANGWTYKNAVTNGAFFQTSARLARYTGNQTFADWATKVWDWSRGVGLVSEDYHVYDGASDDQSSNCTQMNRDEWSYNIASYIHGAAHMANLTGEPEWEQHVQGLVETAAATFFQPAKTGIMFEQKCEPTFSCTIDQTAFKSSLARWLGKTAVLVPSMAQTIMPMLARSASGAAQSCVGYGNSTCGISWTGAGFDGKSDFGVELSALETIQSLLVFEAPPLAVAGNRVPPIQAPPTQAPPTQAPPTQAPPTQAPPTEAPPTQAPPTQAPPTEAPPTQAPPTEAPPTQAPPTQAPPTQAPPTQAPPAQTSVQAPAQTQTAGHDHTNCGMKRRRARRANARR
ncbi:glycoside hydrolase family 76 protein [Xylaria nigripes]|nr:glycoside hydrolase family 76 protein [Xylaria nigripes]